MKSMITIIAILISTVSFANSSKIELNPVHPVNCDENPHKLVTVVYGNKLKIENGKVNIELIWSKGTCSQVLKGEQHASRTTNTIKLSQLVENRKIYLEEASIVSEKTQNNAFVKSVITFDESRLLESKQFELTFGIAFDMLAARFKAEIINNSLSLTPVK